MEKQNDTPVKNPEDAATVGMFLKYTRLNQKKTLDSVSKTLCIRKIYIKAIEDSNFEELPPVPYGIGFVRSYAEYLGLNSDRIVQCYKEESMPQKKEEPLKKATVSGHKILTKPNLRQILIGIAAILCLYLIWLVWCGKTENTPQKTDITVTESQILEEPELPLPDLPILTVPEENPDMATATEEETGMLSENPVTTDESEIPVADSQINITNDSYYGDSPEEIIPETDSRIVVKFKGESWFEVRDDAKIYITGIFEKGYVYNVPNQPGLRLSVGRYYNVDIYVDGKLTTVVRPRKQTNVDLDPFLNH